MVSRVVNNEGFIHLTALVAPRRAGPVEKVQAGVHPFIFVFEANFKVMSIQVSGFKWSPLFWGGGPSPQSSPTLPITSSPINKSPQLPLAFYQLVL